MSSHTKRRQRVPATVKPARASVQAGSIAVVTAWRDHPELEQDYFDAVEPELPDQLVIVDDGSEPPLTFAAVRLEEHGGFSTANNAGLELVETELVVFVNNDIARMRPGWLREVCGLVEPGVLAGPLRFDAHGSVDGVAYPYVDGWCLAGQTADFRRLGGWDEAYDQAGPGYFSDNALSFQARLAGMRLREAVPGLAHKGGQTGGADQELFQRALAANRELFERQVREAIS